MSSRKIADLPADVTVSAAQTLADGYRRYERYSVSLRVPGKTVEQTRDFIRGGKVVAVLPVDLDRDEVVLICQFRLPAHVATGRGELMEIVAGRVESDEEPLVAAKRECAEEIGVAPRRIVELFPYLTTPGITDEIIILFVADVDASKVPERGGSPLEGEQIEILRVTIDEAVGALETGAIRNGPLIIALQWLALNRARLKDLLHA